MIFKISASNQSFQVTLPASVQRLGRIRSGAIVEDLGGDQRPSLRDRPQRSSSVVENILEISSEVSQAPAEDSGVSRRRTVVAEL